MIKDITIVSLSRGVLGEDFIKFELDLGLKRLRDMGLTVRFSANALAGLDFIAAHPEARAADLLEALKSDTDMILCAIGGDDTFRLLPYLFEHDELKEALAASPNQKVFLGFSDTSANHFMFHKLGMPTFYGQSFLADICEIDKDMLPYTRHYFEKLIQTGSIDRITPSDVWYDGREDYSEACLGNAMPSHENQGFELLQGPSRFEGRILGGCIDTIFDFFDGERYAQSPELCSKYSLFPDKEDWEGRILLLETSEETPTPEKYRKMITRLKKTGVFEAAAGVLMGKPMNERYFAEYKQILLEVIDDPDLPILANINIGHATPRCIMPFGVHAVVDADRQEICFG